MKLAITFFLSLLLLACNTTTPKKMEATPVVLEPQAYLLNIKYPVENGIAFLGKIDHTEADQLGRSMLYPGDNGAVFLASVFTHALISSGIRGKEKKKNQEAANEVLEVYQSLIDDINESSLTPESIELMDGRVVQLEIDKSIGSANEWMASVFPVYYLTQSETSLILSNKVRFSQTHNKKFSPREYVVVYVSNNTNADIPSNHWLASNGRNFKDTSKVLLKETLRIAYNTLHFKESNKEGDQKTIRYVENGRKKVERGSIIEQNCYRVVFKTLRGEIKSVPKYRIEKTCKDIPGKIL